MEEKIIKALKFYDIKDEEYKKRCLEVISDINDNKMLQNKVEELDNCQIVCVTQNKW